MEIEKNAITPTNLKISCPSSGFIVDQLKLRYEGEYIPAKPHATFADSLPLLQINIPMNFIIFL
jgi:hypothetical protein